MTKLSVNVNKIATLRNARGGNNPNLTQVVKDCESFGADGITIHPRPDERHVTHKDVFEIKKVVRTEFNIEGYPDARYMEIVEKALPTQATLVPDPPDALTSNAGWDTVSNSELLKEKIESLKKIGVRTSVFVEPDLKMIEGAYKIGVDRIELYTEPYARSFSTSKENAVQAYIESAKLAYELGIGINAGHDLDMLNLAFFKESLPHLDEVSIGHALVCDALYYGLENVIPMYKRQLQ